MTASNPDLSEFAWSLLMWAPTVWYVTAFIASWCGSGPFVFRSIMRARHSKGWLRVDTEPAPGASDRLSESIQPATGPALRYDRVVWVFPSDRLLIATAVLGPILAALLAARWPAPPTLELRAPLRERL